ncbi:hypothetical protein N7319_19260 [Aeromonas dhakensis]|uniref:hypothetical protein n=1 Tax=Aeromonas dhakensis TaxID=196024 RepID=UPI002449DF5C|nr:hypothetical protein [Aeromonas dhakensis]MDH0177343.1 hypothetical protein [Aeromonas dhakensis]
MNKELKNGIILAIVSASFGLGSFYGSQYYQSETKKTEYRLKLTEKLYEKNYEATEELKKSVDGFILLFGNSFALTSYEIKPKLDSFEKALNVYEKHLSELKRLGSSSQIEVAKRYLDWVYSIRFAFNLQYKMATSVEDRVTELLLNKDKDEEFIRFIDDALNDEIERLVNAENYLYYGEGHHKRKVLSDFEQYLNYQFRYELGLEATLDMKTAIERLQTTIDKSNNFVFKEKHLPFAFASGRQLFSETLTLSKAGDIMELKDKQLRHMTKLKFISAVLEHNDSLREEFKSKSSKESMVEVDKQS